MQMVPDVDSCREGLTVEEKRALCHLFDECLDSTTELDHFSDTNGMKVQ
jgi:hypothetical protein